MNPNPMVRGTGAMVLGLWAALAGAAEAPPPALLARLAEQEARVGRVLKTSAYTTRTTVEELDGDGKLLHTRRVVGRVSHPEGKQVVRIDQALLDGKDVTEEERRKNGDRQGRELESPFAASAQGKYRYELLGPDPQDPSKVRIRFEPKQKERSSSTYVGEAVVDALAGEVVRLREGPAENPPFVDRLEVQVELAAPTPAGRQMSVLKVEGKAGLPLFKKGFRLHVDFADYEVAATSGRPAP